MQHVLYPLSVLIVHRADRETLIISLKKDISRCTLKVVVQITLLTFVIFLFMYNGNINEKQKTVHGLQKDVAEKEIAFIPSFDHFGHVTNDLDPFSSPRFSFQNDLQKPLLFGTWRRVGFSPGDTTSSQLEQPRLKSLYCAPSN